MSLACCNCVCIATLASTANCWPSPQASCHRSIDSAYCFMNRTLYSTRFPSPTSPWSILYANRDILYWMSRNIKKLSLPRSCFSHEAVLCLCILLFKNIMHIWYCANSIKQLNVFKVFLLRLFKIFDSLHECLVCWNTLHTWFVTFYLFA